MVEPTNKSIIQKPYIILQVHPIWILIWLLRAAEVIPDSIKTHPWHICVTKGSFFLYLPVVVLYHKDNLEVNPNLLTNIQNSENLEIYPVLVS